MKKILPVMRSKCATCPFKEGSPYAELVPHLTASALSEASRICHSTGGRNAIHRSGTGKPPRICRGARDIQLKAAFAMRVIKEPTYAAWAETLGAPNTK